MSDKFWISRIFADQPSVITSVRSVCRQRNVQTNVLSPGEIDPPHSPGAALLITNDFEGTTLISAFGTSPIPALLVAVSTDLKAVVETVDWNDQEGFEHYSRMHHGLLEVLLTHWQGEFLEHAGVSFADIMKTVVQDEAFENHYGSEASYVFEQLTQQFDFWEMYDRLAEDYDAQACTRIQIPSVDSLGWLGLEALSDNGILFSWKELVATPVM